MATYATIGVVVDPTGAESGAARANAAILKMARAAQEAEQAGRQMAGGLGASFGSAGTASEQMTAKMAQLATQLAALAAGVVSLRGAFDLLNQSVQAASRLEDMNLQLAVVSGSFGKATEQLKLFQSFADRTQFKLGDVSQAGKIIQLFDQGTNTVQGLQKELTTLGDIASVSGRPLADVALVFERLKAGVREGGQIGEYARSLQEMGAIGPSVTIALQNADKFGSSATEKLRILDGALDRVRGATDRANKLYSAQASTLEDQWGHLKETLGQPIMESLKPVLVEAADYLKTNVQPAAAAVGKTLSGWIDTLNGAGMNGGATAIFNAAAGAAGQALGELDKQVTGFINHTVSSVATSLTAALEASSANVDARLKITFLQFAVDVKEALAHPLDFASRHLPSLTGPTAVARADDITAALARLDTGSPPPAASAPSLTLQERLAIAQADQTNASKRVTEALDALRTKIGADEANPGAFSQGYRNAFNGEAGGINALHGVTSSSVPSGFTAGSRSYVFGTTMGGGVDMTDVGRMSDYNAHHGAYAGTDLTNPGLLGAAIGPDQARALTGLSDGIQAQNALLGKYLEIQLGTQNALVQIVDKAPSGHQGIELTPAAHRAVGDLSGDAAIAYRLAGNQQVGAMLKSQYYQGGEVRRAEPISAAEAAFKATGALNFRPDNDAVLTYDNTLKQLSYTLAKTKEGADGFHLSQEEATRQAELARQKLMGSVTAWESLRGKVDAASLALARWNQYSRDTTQKMALDQNGAGNSFVFGLQQASHQQGTQDQQFAKLGGDIYGQLGSSFTSVADSFIDNNGRMKQSFSEMTAQLLKDIAKLIINMLILRAVQQLIGLIPGGGGVAAGSMNTGGYGVATMHSGGMVGSVAQDRQMPAWMFYGAPRYHAGGYLAPGEVPAILQTGEMVLSRGQVSAMASAPRAGNGQGGQSVTINVPIMGGSGGGGRDNGPALTQQDALAMQKQFQAIADERIRRATKYRGALNPG